MLARFEAASKSPEANRIREFYTGLNQHLRDFAEREGIPLP